MEELFEKLKNGGKIVSTSDLNNYDIASARACGRMYVDKDGFGFVYFSKSEPVSS